MWPATGGVVRVNVTGRYIRNHVGWRLDGAITYLCERASALITAARRRWRGQRGHNADLEEPLLGQPDAGASGQEGQGEGDR